MKALSWSKRAISPKLRGYLLLIVFASIMLLLLQHQYWYGEFGNQSLAKLTQQIQEQQRLNTKQQTTNDILRADIADLKSGLTAIEEHARLDFGFIKPNEIFVQTSTAPTVYDESSQEKVSADDVIEPNQEFDESSQFP